MCRGEGRREGRRIARISLRRADRGEVKTKRADWQDLLSAGQPTTSEWSASCKLGIAGQYFVFRGHQLDSLTRIRSTRNGAGVASVMDWMS